MMIDISERDTSSHNYLTVRMLIPSFVSKLSMALSFVRVSRVFEMIYGKHASKK